MEKKNRVEMDREPTPPPKPNRVLAYERKPTISASELSDIDEKLEDVQVSDNSLFFTPISPMIDVSE